MNERGLTTSQGEELYGSYVHNIEKRIDKRQSLLGRYKRTIEDLRVEFHYDENKEKEKDLGRKRVKGRNVKWEK